MSKNINNLESQPFASKQPFASNQRLLLPEDYAYVFKKPIRSSDKLLTILARHHTDQSNSRLGLAVAKKSVKTAVHRNRMKRLSREFFRLNQHKIACADYVILVRRGIDKMDNAVITQSLAKQFNYLSKNLSKNLKKNIT